MNSTSVAAGLFAGCLLIGGAAIVSATLLDTTSPGTTTKPPLSELQAQAAQPVNPPVASITITPSLPADAPSDQPVSIPGREEPEEPVPAASPSAGLTSLAGPSAVADPASGVGQEGPVDVPSGWPKNLPLPDNATLDDIDLTGFQRYLFVKKGSVAITGGRLIEALKAAGWSITTAGTPRSGTIIGTLEDESVSINIRDNADGPGTVSIEVIYLPAAPPDQPTPQPSASRNPLEAKG